MNAAVFYHLFIPPDERFRMWTWWVDEQLGLVKRSRLHEVATINVAITLPKFFRTKEGFFYEEVSEYLSLRYPFVNVISMRDTGEPNIFEGHTLMYLYDYCQTQDGVVCYFHSKGYTSQSARVSCWRQILNHYCIERWPSAVKALDQADVVGIKDKPCPDHMVSGNFWWATTSFIRTRPNPLDSTLYQTRPSFFPGQPDYRYSFEDWMYFGKPRVHYLVDTGTDHFDEYLFLENLLAVDAVRSD